MKICYSPMPVDWEPGPVDSLLSLLLPQWEGTRYMRGAQGLGQGVDCVRFVCAILDGLRGTKTDINTLPQDAAFHSKEGAISAVRKIMRLYEPVRALEAGEAAQPGDVVIVGCSGGGPGHSMIVGPSPRTLWQSSNGTGVVWGGWSIADTYQRLYRIYRLQELV